MIDLVDYYDYTVNSELGRLDSWKNGRMKRNFMHIRIGTNHDRVRFEMEAASLTLEHGWNPEMKLIAEIVGHLSGVLACCKQWESSVSDETNYWLQRHWTPD